MSAARRKKDVRSAAAEPVLGDILRRARLHQGLSLRAIERKTGIPNAHISQIERGIIHRPDPAIVFELATAYDLNFAQLAEWTGYLGPGRDTSRGLLEALVDAFAELDPARQADALAYIESLRAQQ